MKILIAAGGGGHFAPILALLEELPKDVKVLIVGRKYSLEGDQALSLEYITAQKHGIAFQSITTGRLQRKVTKHTFSSFFKLPVGFFQAYIIVKQFAPDIVFSSGGYVSLPVVFAASFCGIPVVLHEQTLGAGLANKIAARFASKICISWKTSQQYFPKHKTVLTGNPVRKAFFTKDSSQQTIFASIPKTRKIIYVTGGSLGSHAINVLIEGCLPQLLKQYTVIHQTGDAKEFGDFDRLAYIRASFDEALQKHYIVTKFVDPQEVSVLMSHADLVVARSGMSTITELLYLGKPALLIPLPFSQKNEQRKNAAFFKETGLGDWVEQKSLTPTLLFSKIQDMVEHIATYEQHADDARKLIDKNAVKKIIDVLTQVVKNA